ncbi:DNA-3-methyladenine glycosylase family protein [Sneathiella chinensis]|uniref:DNA-3-methyladenine glycosylase II n=1 Tax=Sneathiella chinensis TaxID=349750 RepID=A0ABQ5TZM0_9PROT|nr:DNA-3-methyladenine glycosylase 2 family protein [Sneathiella chinensis]GLQ05329.1 DNA-3-methyladenine glycosylase II [Sneathiella chinensis]
MTPRAGLEEGLQHLIRQDEDFARALPLIQPLPDRQRPAGFEQLTRIIVEQQVSLASAEAIWTRLEAAIQPFEPETLLRQNEEQLRALGLSRQKAVYCRALADDIVRGKLNLGGLHALEDEDILAALTEVKGIGRWTAEIYMIACLGRQDIWPAGDVALKIALQHLKGLEERPSQKEMDRHAEPLRPFRTLAARVLWRYYVDVVQPATRKTFKEATGQ